MATTGFMVRTERAAMDTRTERLSWERQPREGEQAYVAFLAYRDLGPYRTHEVTRQRLGKRPGYLKPIERWSALRDWRERARDWDDHLQAERDQIAREEAQKWERRRLQALEEGWQLCRALRARLSQMLAIPPEMPAVAPPEPAHELPESIPDVGAKPEATKPTVGREPTRGDDLAVARLSRLVVELEWALLNEALPPPGAIDPLTATPRELDAYLARHPRPGRPPPR
jgi:hypothetical protein